MKEDIVDTFEKIYTSESDAIFRFCLVRVSNRAEAMDLTEETFLRLWQTLQQGKELQNSRAFIFTIAHRLIIDWYRKKKSLSLDGLLLNKNDNEEGRVKDVSTEENLELKAEGRYFMEKIYELPPVYREPMYLRFVEDLSPVEIGNILHISTSAASVRIHRGVNELQKLYGKGNKTE